MSDTPRTDAMLASVIESDYPAIVAHDFAMFSQGLERELNTLHEQYKELNDHFKEIQEQLDEFI